MFLLRSVGLLTAAALVGQACGALPTESELPRSAAERRSNLPAESELPAAPSPGDDPLPLAVTVGDPTGDLPGESALPIEAGDPAPDVAGPLPLDGSPDGIPWLRLNLSGHTAPLRAVEFLSSQNRFCTAGDDKTVVVWTRDAERDGHWRYERTIRWQIQRGTRGRIYALAAAPGLLAIAGEGAMGGTGEIVLVDPASGDHRSTLFDEAEGHRQVVVALNFVETTRGPGLASLSMDGRTLLWMKNEQGVWRARVATPDDRAAGTPPDLSKRLLAGRAFSAVVALDDRRTVVPVYNGTQGGRLRWRLEIVDAADGSRSPLGGSAGPPHWDHVTAMAADAKRSRLISADGVGGVYIWDLTASPAAVRRLNRPRPGIVLSLSLSSDGARLALGTNTSPDNQNATVEAWDLSDPRRPRLDATYRSRRHVRACSVSTELGAVIYSDGDSAVVRGFAGNDPPQILRGAADAPLRVAFSNDEPFYRIGIGTRPDERGPVVVNRVFDTDRLRLNRADTLHDQGWLPIDWGRGAWRVTESTESPSRRVWAFEEGGGQRARLPLVAEKTGAFRSVCWIPGVDLTSPPLAAIGTSAGGILVVQVTADGEAPIVRRFRGHTSDVTSLAVSRDLRWLVSGSADATVRIWPLGRVAEESGVLNRWGATFEADDAGRLIVASIREDGPLYFRGARMGDEMVSCRWIVDGQHRSAQTPDKLLTTLAEAPWDRVVEYELRTARQATRRFQILPAWQQVASLVLEANGEWAFWAPSGYYDASFQGHRLFGWQINRGLDELPDFFLAAQFRRILERSDAMSRLLREGSIEAAFRAVRAEVPVNSAQTIANAYRLKPEVTILSPSPDTDLADESAGRRLRAEIRVPAGQTLVRPKAFANGVVARPGELVGRETDRGSELRLYEWRLAVPSDPRVLVQVIASTADEITDSDQLVLANSALRPDRKPRLFLLAVAIDGYRDAQIPKLRTPVAHAEAVTNLLRSQSSALYEVEATSLFNERATRQAWTFLTKNTADRLREESSPDNLLVVYLSGHGVQDAAGERYHFLTAGAEYAEIMAGSYADCLSFADFSQFSDISCRKLVILDTCHSGAIQPMRHREMKAAVRALQEDVLITVAASDGAEEAVEGRFSTRLIEALEGAADREGGNRDGVVRLNEVIAYLRRTVSEDSRWDTHVQTPSAGPADLLPFTAPPLSIGHARDQVGQRNWQRRESGQYR